jgi:segregation and condensation protein B
VGRGDTPGRPVLFGTSNEFLRYFGFKSIGELPSLDEETDEENGTELTV